MHRLHDNQNITFIDRATIAQGTSSYELIDRASQGFVKWIKNFISSSKSIHIICGPGNNGADGYLVGIKLSSRGFPVTIFTVSTSSKCTPENEYFRDQIDKNRSIKHVIINTPEQCHLMNGEAVLIDAILGNGINKTLAGKIGQIVTYLNKTYELIFGLDVPTGLMPAGNLTEHAMRCSATCAFQFPRLSFFVPEHEKFIGRWDFIDIGLSRKAIESTPTRYFLVEKRDIRNLATERSQFAHKGMMGKALIMMPSSNMMGAGILSARSCLKMGAGITYVYTTSGRSLATSNLPEIIFIEDITEDWLESMDSVCIGPGLGVSEKAVTEIDFVLNSNLNRLILDADALNIISQNGWQSRIPKRSIITPHVKEFQRLFGPCNSHYERVEMQISQAVDLGIYIILKGRYTSIATPSGKLYYNMSGNPALAKGGSGDVLTGMITALCAQGYDPSAACLTSVYLHGYASDLFVRHHHEITMTPSDLICYLSVALKNLNF